MGLRFLLPERITGRVEIDWNGCWIWGGAVDSGGYGNISWEGGTQKAHRLFFAAFRRAPTAGKQLHHECENRLCCNPFHLVEMGHIEHMMSDGRAPILTGGECKRCGTPLEGDNVYVDKKSGDRHCKTCKNLATAAWNARRGEKRREKRLSA